MNMNPQWRHWPHIKTLVSAFEKAGVEMRFVGGAVRDAVLDRVVQDVDVATPALPQAVMDLLTAAGIKSIPTGIDHGTITAVIDGKGIEITTLRKDAACDGRHAEVVYTDNWKEDAQRRDFTMNALYLSTDGTLTDYFSGAQDAKSGRVIFIGDALQRVAEDYLRILRFFRFHALYGSGAPDASALKICASQAHHIEGLSAERIQAEMLKLLMAKGCASTLQVMIEHKILGHTLGFEPIGVSALSSLENIESYTSDLGISVRLAALLLPSQKEESLLILASRFRLPKLLEKEIRTIITYHQEISPDLNERFCKHWIRKLGALFFKRMVALNWAQMESVIRVSHPYHAMIKLADTWQIPVFPISGDDLITKGVTPGKAMGDLLQQLENAWEASGYTLTREQLLKLV